jgi:hypothetical protein
MEPDPFPNRSAEQDIRRRAAEKENVVTWLCSLEFNKKQNEVLTRRQQGTGEWFFENTIFQQWLAGRERKLWCHGIRVSPLS